MFSRPRVRLRRRALSRLPQKLQHLLSRRGPNQLRDFLPKSIKGRPHCTCPHRQPSGGPGLNELFVWTRARFFTSFGLSVLPQLRVQDVPPGYMHRDKTNRKTPCPYFSSQWGLVCIQQHGLFAVSNCFIQIVLTKIKITSSGGSRPIHAFYAPVCMDPICRGSNNSFYFKAPKSQ